MNEPVLDEIINRLNLLEKKIVQQEKDFESRVMKYISYHTHLMNGHIHWQFPQDILDKKIEEMKNKLTDKIKTQQNQTANFKEKLNSGDDFNFNITEVKQDG